VDVFDFKDAKLVMMEQRFYIDPLRPDMPPDNHWPSKRMPRLQKDEAGRQYFRQWTCENSVTS
jgi:hypothetical protein